MQGADLHDGVLVGVTALAVAPYGWCPVVPVVSLIFNVVCSPRKNSYGVFISSSVSRYHIVCTTGERTHTLVSQPCRTKNKCAKTRTAG